MQGRLKSEEDRCEWQRVRKIVGKGIYDQSRFTSFSWFTIQRPLIIMKLLLLNCQLIPAKAFLTPRRMQC